MQEEIKSRLKSGNACNHSVQNLVLGCYPKMYRTIILPVVFYGCETWSLPLREECRLRVLRRIFETKWGEVTG
jgi:hypothetical protein